MDDNIPVISGIVRFSFYIKFKERIKTFVLHFDFTQRVVVICKRGKAIISIDFKDIEDPVVYEESQTLLSIRTNEPKQYDIYTISNYERLEILYYLSLIAKDPVNCKCTCNNILVYQTFLQKKGKMKWSNRFVEVYNNQLVIYKNNHASYPTNVISLSELSMKIFDKNGIIIKNINRIYYLRLAKEESRDLLYNKLISIGIQNSRKSIIKRKNSLALNSINSLSLHFFPSDFKTLHSIFQYPGIDLKQIHLENSSLNQENSNQQEHLDSILEIEKHYNNQLEEIKNRTKTISPRRTKRLMSRKSVQELIKKYNSISEQQRFIDENGLSDNPENLENDIDNNENQYFEEIDTNDESSENFKNLITRIDNLNSSCDEIISFLTENKNNINSEILNNIKLILENNYRDEREVLKRTTTSLEPLSLSLSNESLLSDYSTSCSEGEDSLSSASAPSSPSSKSSSFNYTLSSTPSPDSSFLENRNNGIDQDTNMVMRIDNVEIESSAPATTTTTNTFSLSPKPPPVKFVPPPPLSPEILIPMKSDQFIDFRRFSRDLIPPKIIT